MHNYGTSLRRKKILSKEIFLVKDDIYYEMSVKRYTSHEVSDRRNRVKKNHIFQQSIYGFFTSRQAGLELLRDLLLLHSYCASQKEMDIETSVTNYTIFWYF